MEDLEKAVLDAAMSVDWDYQGHKDNLAISYQPLVRAVKRLKAARGQWICNGNEVYGPNDAVIAVLSSGVMADSGKEPFYQNAVALQVCRLLNQYGDSSRHERVRA